MGFDELKKYAVLDILSASGKEKSTRVIENHMNNLIEVSLIKGAQSRQAEADELQKRIDVCEKLRDSQFEKLWGLTQAIEIARNGADEDFDMFLNHLSNILKGEQNEN